MTTRAEAALERAARLERADRPSHRRCFEEPGEGLGVVLGTLSVARDRDESDREGSARGLDTPVRLRAATGTAGPGVVGVASVVEEPYEMYDMFGPYTEIVSRSAFDETLAANPLVEFTLNHNRSGGAAMAHTRNGTLQLWTSDQGLEFDASVDGRRSDVNDMLLAIERGDQAESSFKFRITSGQWSPDYTEFRINAVDLSRGDVSTVNFGANPLATSGLREGTTVTKARILLVPDEFLRHRTR